MLTACLAGVSREDYGANKSQKRKPKPPTALEKAAQSLQAGRGALYHPVSLCHVLVAHVLRLGVGDPPPALVAPSGGSPP